MMTFVLNIRKTTLCVWEAFIKSTFSMDFFLRGVETPLPHPPFTDFMYNFFQCGIFFKKTSYGHVCFHCSELLTPMYIKISCTQPLPLYIYKTFKFIYLGFGTYYRFFPTQTQHLMWFYSKELQYWVVVHFTTAVIFHIAL